MFVTMNEHKTYLHVWLAQSWTMAIFKSINNLPLLQLCFLISSGFQAYGLSYDYSFTHECLKSPLKPQYDGGIVVNPEFSEGLKGWSAFGDVKLGKRKSKDGNKFIVAFDRSDPFHSLSQKFDLDKEKLYVISAWLRVSKGESHLRAVFKTSTGFQHAGSVIARSGCWSMLKGGLVVNASGPAHLYFEGDNPTVEIWADSISLQPFTKDEWKSHQDQSLEKTRKSKVSIKAVDPKGRPLANAKVSIKQLRNNFPFGVAINSNILSNQAYQSWFTSRSFFKFTVFENELKWFSTEKSPGREDYSAADALLQFAKQHNLQVRGHNIFWDDPAFNPSWVQGLSSNDLSSAANRRINSLVRRYAGQFIHWDVVNENIHHNFFESKLGPNISAVFYREANQIDGRATPFLNDFNTIEQSGDPTSTPAKYLQKISELRRQGYGGPLGIGLEGHFNDPNLPFVRTAIDTLASARLPIWVTELDVSRRPNQANDLDQLIRETSAHPAVNGLLIWGAWSPQGCFRMCLTDNNFKNLPTGDVVDRIARELTHQGLIGATDINGVYETSLFHGDYEVEITHPSQINSSLVQTFEVASTTKHKIVNFLDAGIGS